MKVAVYLGSRSGRGDKYLKAAYELGSRLAAEGFAVVYGGSSIGTMGALAEGIASQDGECIGVFPEGFKGKPEVVAAGINIRGSRLTEDIIVRNFSERKAVMEQISDCCVALPGSWGTLDELFTYAIGSELKFNGGKKIYILNLDGYYDALRAHIDKMLQEEFISEASSRVFTFVPDVQTLLQELLSDRDSSR